MKKQTIVLPDSKNRTGTKLIAKGCEDKPLCDSVVIAKRFGKEHKHILEKIDKLKKELDNKQFRVITETYATSRGREYKHYLLSLPATLLLIMSFERHAKGQLELSAQIVSMIDNAAKLFEAIQDIDIDIKDKELYVYIAQEEMSGRYKIGISKDPNRRISQLQTGNPEKLTLILTYKAHDEGFADETILHKKNKNNHIRGEWFQQIEG